MSRATELHDMLVKYNGLQQNCKWKILVKLYNETERHYNAHYNNTKQYYSNQHYNKADNKDPKQNVIERKTERKHFA